MPVSLTRLMGRAREIAEVQDLVRRPDVRLLTLTGPGGVGKTRLALAAVAGLDEDFPDGMWFVPLAAITDPALVPAAIAQVLGLRETSQQSPTHSLTSHLRHDTALLLLDNLEQVLAAAPFLVDLLAACPTLTILVTSRAALRATGEHEWVVPPLGLPDLASLPSDTEIAACEAVALFVERVRAFRPEFVLTTASAPIVAEICHRLDGLPLAIELAAARVKVLSPPALLARLTNRLQLLSGGPCDQPVRLRAMRDAIAWSYDLLTPDEQALFRQLAIFVGGCSLDAAEAVGGETARRRDGEETDNRSFPPSRLAASSPSVLDGLGLLVDKSLLRPVTGPGGAPRFAMLETIREFGLEQLSACGEAQAARRRHATFFLTLAEQGAPARAEKAPEAARLDQLAADHDNLRAALVWTTETGSVTRTLRLAWALWAFWLVHGHLSEGRRWLDAAIAGGRGDPTRVGLLGKALYGAAWLAIEQGDDAAARAFGDESLALARDRGDPEGIAYALGPLGFLAHQQGDLDRATTLHREALAIKRALGDDEGSAVTLTYLAHIALDRGEINEATSLGQEALATHRALGKRRHIALTLDILGDVAFHQGDDGRASEHFEEALTIFRDLRGKRGIASVFDHLGKIARGRGDHARAWAFHAEALDLHQEQGNAGSIAAWLDAVVSMLACCHQYASAARLFGTATVLREQAGRPRSRLLELENKHILASPRRGLGERAFAAAQSAGRELPVDHAITEVMAVTASALSGSSPPPSDAAPAPFGLTSREQDVLRLLAQHFTDKEIAQHLFISPRTVGRHITNLFTKLGVHSRREAAALAQDRDLA
ncbi:MAG: tetratricopeptide repeat protein [Thermomicrobiales bacterium]